MVKQITLLLATTLLLASCSTKVNLVKRKYNKGYYVSLVKKQHAAENDNKEAIVQKPVQAKQNKVVSETAVAIVAPETDKPANNKIALQRPVRPNANTPLARPQQATASALNNANNNNITRQVKALPEESGRIKTHKQAGTKTKANDDTTTILLVILCLFWWLNLVAVYLHDGKKITLNFWVTLLLDLLLILGVVFSILVVLDIINLT